MFKFEIGEEIKSINGGWNVSNPGSFTEDHKKAFPSDIWTSRNELISKRMYTEKYGNWYQMGDGNWVSENGLVSLKPALIVTDDDYCITY